MYFVLLSLLIDTSIDHHNRNVYHELSLHYLPPNRNAKILPHNSVLVARYLGHVAAGTSRTSRCGPVELDVKWIYRLDPSGKERLVYY